jgi:hypothetical protein
MAFSPLKIWLSLEAGRAILVASSPLLIPSTPMTSSRYSPGGMARSECATDSVFILPRHGFPISFDSFAGAFVVTLQLPGPEPDVHAPSHMPS